MIGRALRKRFTAFTLSEILVVIAIIGVLAMLLLPMLFSNVQSLQLETARETTSTRIFAAMNTMKVQEKLDGYQTTDEFVDELQKYVKVAKRCESSDLSGCFTKTIKDSSDKNIEVSELTTGDKLATKNKNSYGTNNVALGIVNGAQMILSYKSGCMWQSPYGPSNPLSCLAALYDVNGFKGPNKIGKDIGVINGELYSQENDAAPIVAALPPKPVEPTMPINWSVAPEAVDKPNPPTHPAAAEAPIAPTQPQAKPPVTPNAVNQPSAPAQPSAGPVPQPPTQVAPPTKSKPTSPNKPNSVNNPGSEPVMPTYLGGSKPVAPTEVAAPGNAPSPVKSNTVNNPEPFVGLPPIKATPAEPGKTNPNCVAPQLPVLKAPAEPIGDSGLYKLIPANVKYNKMVEAKYDSDLAIYNSIKNSDTCKSNNSSSPTLVLSQPFYDTAIDDLAYESELETYNAQVAAHKAWESNKTTTTYEYNGTVYSKEADATAKYNADKAVYDAAVANFNKYVSDYAKYLTDLDTYNKYSLDYDINTQAYQKKLAEYQTQKQAYDKYVKDLAAYNDAYEQYTKDIASYNSEQAKYNQDVAAYNDAKKKYDQDTAAYAQNNSAQLAAYNAAYAKYQQDLSDYQTYQSELAKYNDDLQKYKKGTSEYDAAYAEYQKKLAEYNSKKEQDLAAYNAAYDKYQKDLAKYDEYLVKKATYDKMYEDYQKSYSEFEEAYAKYQQDIDAYNKAYREYNETTKIGSDSKP